MFMQGMEGTESHIVHTPTRRNNNRGQRWHRGSGAEGQPTSLSGKFEKSSQIRSIIAID